MRGPISLVLSIFVSLTLFNQSSKAESEPLSCEQLLTSVHQISVHQHSVYPQQTEPLLNFFFTLSERSETGNDQLIAQLRSQQAALIEFLNANPNVHSFLSREVTEISSLIQVQNLPVADAKVRNILGAMQMQLNNQHGFFRLLSIRENLAKWSDFQPQHVDTAAGDAMQSDLLFGAMIGVHLLPVMLPFPQGPALPDRPILAPYMTVESGASESVRERAQKIIRENRVKIELWTNEMKEYDAKIAIHEAEVERIQRRNGHAEDAKESQKNHLDVLITYLQLRFSKPQELSNPQNLSALLAQLDARNSLWSESAIFAAAQLLYFITLDHESAARLANAGAAFGYSPDQLNHNFLARQYEDLLHEQDDDTNPLPDVILAAGDNFSTSSSRGREMLPSSAEALEGARSTTESGILDGIGEFLSGLGSIFD